MFEFEQVSKIRNTNNGDNWNELAGGNKTARAAATYVHYDTPACVPLSVIAFEWVGELPSRK